MQYRSANSTKHLRAYAEFGKRHSQSNLSIAAWLMLHTATQSALAPTIDRTIKNENCPIEMRLWSLYIHTR
jgi:hypothetical protein